MSLTAAAQSSFTVTSNGKEYSFPISSEITVTDNELWKPEVVEVERQFKSNFKELKADFQSSFSTTTQKSETGVTEYKDAYLIADHVWEIDFTTNDYKRVQLMVREAGSPDAAGNGGTDDLRKILAEKSNTQSNLGLCNMQGTAGNFFTLKDFGKDGKWAWIYNELTNSYIIVNKDTQAEDAYDFSSLKATIDKVATKDLNINNVSDKWKFMARVSDDNTAEKDSMVEIKLRANPETNKSFTLDGIPYKVNTGKVTTKLEGIELNGSFPDEYDIAKGNEFDFRFWKDALNDPEGVDFMLVSGTELPENMDYTQTNAEYPEFTIQDKNTLVSKNGMVFCKFKKTDDGSFKIYKKIVVPEGTALRRSATYPEATVKEVHDTVYIVKHDTIIIKPLTTDELITAGEYAESKLGSKTSLYSFESDNEFAQYASYYEQALKVDPATISEDKKTAWEEAVEQLKYVATAYGYYTKNLMNPSKIGSYLVMGQGNINSGMAFNKRLDVSSSTVKNGYSLAGGSGYVAYAKLGVACNDAEVFSTPFNTTYMGNAPCFGGAETVDVFVLFSPVSGKYTPVYMANQNGLVFEQWKGDNKVNFDSVEEAITHLGKSSGNMADRSWVKLNIDDEGARTIVANGLTVLPDFSAYSDIEVVTTCADVTPSMVGVQGLTIDTTTNPMTFSNAEGQCDFSGAAVFTAKDANGDKVALIMFLQNKKYYMYSYELNN